MPHDKPERMTKKQWRPHHTEADKEAAECT